MLVHDLGVLATVAAGLYVSWNGPQLISAATRLQGIFFWDLFVYLMEGFVFLLTGLQARIIFESAKTFPFQEIVIETLLTTAIIIVARFIWVYPATYLPRFFPPSAGAIPIRPGSKPSPSGSSACAAWYHWRRRSRFR